MFLIVEKGRKVSKGRSGEGQTQAKVKGSRRTLPTAEGTRARTYHFTLQSSSQFTDPKKPSEMKSVEHREAQEEGEREEERNQFKQAIKTPTA